MGELPWLVVIGIGEDGLEGLSAVAIAHLSQAEVIVGGDRHLKFLSNPSATPDSRLPTPDYLQWGSPIETTVEQILARRNQRVVVVASGDPLWYGIGTTLLRYVPITELLIIPAPSSFSWACARLGWSLPEVETLSLCGRPLALLHGVLYPGARIVALSAGAKTPLEVAQLLCDRGWNHCSLTILEHLGGPQERIRTRLAQDWLDTDPGEIAALNAIAIACPSLPLPSSILRPPSFHPRTPGLPDHAYDHDGQLTKREVRAVTLAALAPVPGELLWDVGAGSGSIGIEWMRSHPRCRAIAIEAQAKRGEAIARNAQTLGVPTLQIVMGQAPEALEGLPQPDAIFIGGGLTRLGVLEACWEALGSGGRLVANAVTVETELQLFQAQQRYGGDLSRIAVQRAEPLGQFLGWKAMANITQWQVTKG